MNLPRGRTQAITLALASGPREILATVYPPSPLAIHRPAIINYRREEPDGAIETCKVGWTVTHTPTGHRLFSTRLRSEARKCVAQMMSLDWEVCTDGPLVTVTEGERRSKLRDQIREIRDSGGGYP